MNNTNNNGRGIFLAVVGIATLIVTAIGATFAFFVASASGNAGKAAANSATFANTLTLSESYDTRTQLIPVTESIMKTSFGQTGADGCKGYSAAGGATKYDLCSTYTFTVTNTASVAQDVHITFTTVSNSFTNLYYMIVDGADNSSSTPTVRKTAGAVPTTGAANAAKDIVQDTLTATNGSHTYTLILWINETTNDQTSADSGKSFTGTVSISSGSNTSNITGVINQVNA